MENLPRTYDGLVAAAGGTVTALATLIQSPVTTVHKWKKAGIPDWRWPQIEAAFRTREDFEDQNRGRTSGDSGK
jgi:hypothetical protein